MEKDSRGQRTKDGRQKTEDRRQKMERGRQEAEEGRILLKLFVGNIREWYNSDSIFGEANKERISKRKMTDQNVKSI